MGGGSAQPASVGGAIPASLADSLMRDSIGSPRVYQWFTEGFDTRDLKEAKALLVELA